MKKVLRVLSLFDGMSCAQIALKNLQIPCIYYASETDEYAIKTTQKNFPNTIQVGDLAKLKGSALGEIDLIIGGFPCQDFSVAGTQEGFTGSRGSLFFEFVRILKEVKPTWFLAENVKMKKLFKHTISVNLGVEPVLLNSANVSAQRRERLYWTNIRPSSGIIEEPVDKGLVLQDILEHGYTDKLKSYCLTANYYKSTDNDYLNKKKAQRVYNVNPSQRGINGNVYSTSGKSPTLTINKGEGPKIDCIGDLPDKERLYRKLTIRECARLQTVPDWYQFPCSNSQSYKMLGNAFTVDIISHLLAPLAELAN